MKLVKYLTLGLILAAGCSLQTPEPSYGGVKLSEWLNYGHYQNDGSFVWSPGAQEAILGLGTNALPWLESELKVPDDKDVFTNNSGAERHRKALFAIELIQSQATAGINGLTPLFEVLDNYNDGRYSAIEALKKAGSEAVPTLLIGLKHPDEQTREKSAEALGQIQPASTNAVPALLVALKDPVPQVRAAAALALGEIHTQPETVVPELLDIFRSAPSFVAHLPPKPTVVNNKVMFVKSGSVTPKWQFEFLMNIRVAVVQALGHYGPEASQALPELNAYLRQPRPTGFDEEIADRNVRAEIRDALPRITGSTGK